MTAPAGCLCGKSPASAADCALAKHGVLLRSIGHGCKPDMSLGMLTGGDNVALKKTRYNEGGARPHAHGIRALRLLLRGPAR